MKLIPAAALLFLLASCNNDEPGKVAATPVKRDTPLIKKEPANPYLSIDVSPMDIIYFPEDYPILKMSGKLSTPPVARVIYSRPHRQGRTIFGALLKYGEPWRLGANEATEIEIFQPVTIQGKTVNKGKYILYCIPYQDKWTIVFNSNVFTWGLRPDTSKDVHRFDVPVRKTETSIEYFTMVFDGASRGADLLMAWDAVEVRLPIQVK